ncbi:hypothetical protein [[Clostridium] innocuum]|uniref:hypothetical protein n=1 Tax=Clostridium innocuum TaxID=1522 RepID=UPI000D79EB8F|nr:hypothetical protein [[Clostridium] innocuum]PWJ10865.1 hypothetical protein ATF84_11929 [[Clostridium] innocuum]SSA48483.1 hypothetical protein SAMN04487929_11929 [[Clostridium] innocuum]
MQGKIFAIPYAAWIAAFVFDVLIIIDSYPAALLLFLLLSYHSHKKFFLKQAGTYKILICLDGEIFLSLVMYSHDKHIKSPLIHRPDHIIILSSSRLLHIVSFCLSHS